MDYKLVMMEWEDSRQPTSEWAHVADIEAPDKAVLCVSVGWLIHDLRNVKVIAASLGDIADDGALQASGVMRLARLMRW